jgi:hypothetical protein
MPGKLPRFSLVRRLSWMVAAVRSCSPTVTWDEIIVDWQYYHKNTAQNFLLPVYTLIFIVFYVSILVLLLVSPLQAALKNAVVSGGNPWCFSGVVPGMLCGLIEGYLSESLCLLLAVGLFICMGLCWLVNAIFRLVTTLTFPARLAWRLGQEISLNLKMMGRFHQVLSPWLDGTTVYEISKQALQSGGWYWYDLHGPRLIGQLIANKEIDLLARLSKQTWPDLAALDLGNSAITVLFTKSLWETDLFLRILAALVRRDAFSNPENATALARPLASLSSSSLGKVLNTLCRLDADTKRRSLAATLSAAQRLDSRAGGIFIDALILSPVEVCEAILAESDLG